MMKVSCLALGLLLALAGCNVFKRDLISQGVYGLETTGVVGCEVAAAAVEKEGYLQLSGFIRGARLTAPVTGEVEVWFRTPDGKQRRETRVPLRLVNHRRTSHSHPRFEAVIRQVPPPGTVIMLVPIFPLCPQIEPSTSKTRDAKEDQKEERGAE